MSEHPLLEVRGVDKRFGAVEALADVNFHADLGQVMALVGDNGAGKSTLIKCIAGIYTIDNGDILWEGEPVSIHGPKDSGPFVRELKSGGLQQADCNYIFPIATAHENLITRSEPLRS